MIRFALVLSLCLGLSAFAESDPHSEKPASKKGSLLDGFPLGGKSRTLGAQDIPLDDDSWIVLECLSDGTCKYRNRITGEIRLVQNKDFPKPDGQAESDAAGQTASAEEPANGPLTDEEKKTLAEPDVADLAEFKKRVALARRAGKKFILLQVGNLEGCPPCQQINRQIQGSALAKDESIAFVDFNYLKGAQDMKDMLHQIKLPNPFSFPYVYVMELDETRAPFNDKNEWQNRYAKLDRNMALNVNSIIATVDAMKKNPLKPAEKK